MAKATNKKAAASKKTAGKKVAVKQPAKKAAAKKAPQKQASKKIAMKKVAVKSAPRKAAVSDETMLQTLFVESLKDIYYAEKSLIKVLPRLSKAATSPDLREVFNEHVAVTEGQLARLEQVFEQLGKKAQGKRCEAMDGLTREAESMVKDTKKGSETRDVALIMAAQKVEHYEIATYGSLATLAAQMGLSEAKNLLGQTLQEEKDTDVRLTELAESNINQQAEQEGGEGEAGEGGSGGDEENLSKEAQVE
jgi:ferritin-like metal-binding protein YciE